MNELIPSIISALSLATVAGQILIVGLIIFFFLPKKKNTKASQIYTLLKENSLTLMFLVASASTLGSLFLSEVANLVPCQLCWWQRIFMYPQAIILLIALIKNDNGVAKYVLSLSVIGALIAIYHYIMQLFPNVLECSEEVAKCSVIQFAEFGYITIPVMSFTAFLLLGILSLIQLRK